MTTRYGSSGVRRCSRRVSPQRSDHSFGHDVGGVVRAYQRSSKAHDGSPDLLVDLPISHRPSLVRRSTASQRCTPDQISLLRPREAGGRPRVQGTDSCGRTEITRPASYETHHLKPLPNPLQGYGTATTDVSLCSIHARVLRTMVRNMMSSKNRERLNTWDRSP